MLTWHLVDHLVPAMSLSVFSPRSAIAVIQRGNNREADFFAKLIASVFPRLLPLHRAQLMRAGMVAHPNRYRWSSYHAPAGDDKRQIALL